MPAGQPSVQTAVDILASSPHTPLPFSFQIWIVACSPEKVDWPKSTTLAHAGEEDSQPMIRRCSLERECLMGGVSSAAAIVMQKSRAAGDDLACC